MTEVSVRQKIRFLFDPSRNPDRFSLGHPPRGSHRVPSGLIPQRPALSSLKIVAARCLYATKLSCLSCGLARICNTSASIAEYLSRSIVQIKSRFRSSRRMISIRRKSPAEYLGEPEGLPPAGQSTPAGGRGLGVWSRTEGVAGQDRDARRPRAAGRGGDEAGRDARGPDRSGDGAPAGCRITAARPRMRGAGSARPGRGAQRKRPGAMPGLGRRGAQGPKPGDDPGSGNLDQKSRWTRIRIWETPSEVVVRTRPPALIAATRE